MAGLLAEHNKYRARHHAPPLTWNTTLADAATRWTSNCLWEHDPQRSYGENLYMMSSEVRQPMSLMTQDAIRLWYEEVNTEPYDYNRPTYNHFTQVVWKSSKQLGCGYTHCPGGHFIMSCKYSPPGNYIGQSAANVLPP